MLSLRPTRTITTARGGNRVDGGTTPSNGSATVWCSQLEVEKWGQTHVGIGPFGAWSAAA